MQVTLSTEELRDAENNLIRECESLDLWGCSIRGISTISESYVSRGSKNRTLENAIRRDITGVYRVWKIGYQLLDYSRFKKIKEFYDLQCSQLVCLKLKITNYCGEQDCECSNVSDTVNVEVTMDLGDLDYIDNGSYIEDFTVTFEESKSCDCQNCGA
jgi:hypothetical protein